MKKLKNILLLFMLFTVACGNAPAATAKPVTTTAPASTSSVSQIPMAEPEKFDGQTVEVLSCSPTKTGLTRIHTQGKLGEHLTDVSPMNVWVPSVKEDLEITGYISDISPTRCPAGSEVLWRDGHTEGSVELYVVFVPTENDKKVDAFYQTYARATPKFGGEAFDLDVEPSSQGQCYVMLRNFWQVSAWNEENYNDLFDLCTGDRNLTRTSMGYLRSVNGMGEVRPWRHDGYEPENDLTTMTFMTPPANSEILGTITPCTKFPISLGYDMRITGVTTPGADDIVVDDWQFPYEEVFDAELSFFNDDLGTESFVAGTYLGFIQSDQIRMSEWEELYSSDSAQTGTISLYKISDCEGK